MIPRVKIIVAIDSACHKLVIMSLKLIAKMSFQLLLGENLVQSLKPKKSYNSPPHPYLWLGVVLSLQYSGI